MDNVFIYKWCELKKECRLTPKLIIQGVLLVIAIGILPDILLMAAGYHTCQFLFLLLAIPVVLIMSLSAYKNHPVSDITTSSVTMNKSVIQISRYVISETGRKFYVIWDTDNVSGFKIDEEHRIIQIVAKWNITAFRKEHGDIIDTDVRTYPQTLHFSPEGFFNAFEYIRENFDVPIDDMTPEEYKQAWPFIHKHYEIE